MVRLRTVDPSSRGWTRRRVGKGFTYLDEHGERISDPETVARLRDRIQPGPTRREARRFRVSSSTT